MVQFYPSIPPHLSEWALTLPLFFTASAPLSGSHVNISPKGLPASTFRILSPNLAAYIDATGSGSETIAHVYENRRVTIMFCSFGAAPRIMRLFCWGKVVEWDQEPEFGAWIERLGGKRVEGARAILVLDVWKDGERVDVRDLDKVQTSCGYGVPLLSSSSSSPPPPSAANGESAAMVPELKDRDTLGHWASKLVAKDDMRRYQKDWNAYSLDGLPALRVAMRDTGHSVLWGRVKSWKRRISVQKEALSVGILVGASLVLLIQWLLRMLG